MYLGRLKRYDPLLHFVVTLTEERGLAQARKADEEIAAGKYRGPLHGIPWGAKDLFAVKGYKTTWGAEPFKDQVIDEDATVVQRLDAAGAVLVAKLTCGALAMGDVWFGGKTRNPWNVEDCALVFSVLQGTDGQDLAVVDAPFVWDARLDIRTLRVGYAASIFEKKAEVDPDAEKKEEDLEWPVFDKESIDALIALGLKLVPVDLPDLPADSMALLLMCEAAAAFDDLTLSGCDALLTAQGDDDWPNLFRQAQLIPAVQYIQANRARTVLMRAMDQMFTKTGVDAYVCPSFGGSNLTITNLTGHPQVVVPNGFRAKNGTPASICFTGRLFEEGKVLALAKAYQDATGFRLKHPALKG